MNIWKYIWFASCLAFMGVSCSWETKSDTQDPQQEQKESQQVDQNADSVIKGKDKPEVATSHQHASFESYWKDFRASVLEKNKQHVAELTDFPFVDGQGEMYREENLSSQNPEEFMQKYDRLFSKALIPIIRDSVPVGAEAGLEIIPDEPMLAPGEYLLQVPEELSLYYPGLFFKKVDGFYYLKSIPYTP